MDRITKGRDHTDEIPEQLFRNRQDARTWYVEAIQTKQNTLKGVDISQQDADGNIITKWYADHAVFNPADKSWTFYRGKKVNFDKQGNDSQGGRHLAARLEAHQPAGRRPSGASSAPMTTRRTSRSRNCPST